MALTALAKLLRVAGLLSGENFIFIIRYYHHTSQLENYCRTAGLPSLLQVVLIIRILLNYLLRRKHNWIFKQRYTALLRYIIIAIQCLILCSMQEGWTALSLASWKGHAEIVQILVQAGIQINIQGQVYGIPTLTKLASSNVWSNLSQIYGQTQICGQNCCLYGQKPNIWSNFI